MTVSPNIQNDEFSEDKFPHLWCARTANGDKHASDLSFRQVAFIGIQTFCFGPTRKGGFIFRGPYRVLPYSRQKNALWPNHKLGPLPVGRSHRVHWRNDLAWLVVPD